jgi:hypothetical protein
METKNSNVATSDPYMENQTIDGFVSELEREIGNSLEVNGVPKAKTFSARLLLHANARKRSFGDAKSKNTGSAEKGSVLVSVTRVHPTQAVEIPIPRVTRLFDEISLAGEMVGFGIGFSLRLTVLSAATFLVVGSFSVIVFLHAVGRGFMKKHWDLRPR